MFGGVIWKTHLERDADMPGLGRLKLEGIVILHLVITYSFITSVVIFPIIFSFVSLVDFLLWVSWSNIPARDVGLMLSRT